MADSGAIRAGRAFVELFADDSKLVKGLASAQKKLTAFGAAVKDIGKKMAALGAAVAAPMIAATKSFGTAGSDLVQMSARTGIAIEALGQLKYAAEQTGVQIEHLETGITEMETGIRQMQKTLLNAAKGSKDADQSLAMLGISIKDLANLTPDEQFKRLADGIASIQDPTMRAAMSMEIFGRSGTMLLPLIEKGSEGIDAYGKKARELGIVLSTQTAESAHKFESALSTLWSVIASGKNAIGEALAPGLTRLSQIITDQIQKVVLWIKEHKDLVVTVFKTAAAVVAGGMAIMGLGYAIMGVGKAFGILGSIISGTVTLFQTIGAVLAWACQPAVLLAAAIIALGAYIVYASGAGGKALSWLGERFQDLKDDVLEAYSGISDALAAGDIGLAARILWLTLKMEWVKGTTYISDIWNSALQWLKQRATEAFYGLVMVSETIWHGLEVAWIETTAFMSGVWTNFCAGIHQAWMWVAKSLQETWNKIKHVFDSTFDADAANKAIEEQYGKAKDQMWTQAKKHLADREQERKAQREVSAANYQATIPSLLTEGEAQKGKQEQEFNEKMAANQQELDQARKEWQAAVNKARRERTEKFHRGGPAPDADDYLAKAKKALGGLNLGDMSGQFKAAGTFNPAAAWGMAGGNLAQRIATATEKTASNTAALVNKKVQDTAQFKGDNPEATFA
jgi:hypothetical protein